MLMMFVCSLRGYALQGGERPETSRTTSKGGSSKVAGGVPRKPIGVVKKAPINSSIRITKKDPNSIVRPKVLPEASLSISVMPLDSAVLLDGQEVKGLKERNDNGAINLKPGTYVITARKVGYSEQQRTVVLSSGQSLTVELNLSPLPGKLSVTPNVAGADISINGQGNYSGSINDLMIGPGTYEITISKSGYEKTIREVIIEPAQTITLDVALEPIKRVPVRTSMTLSTSNEGKYVVISMTGSSDALISQSGSIEATVDSNSVYSSMKNISGLLPGYPCRVDITPLENVSEYSIKEAPGSINGWERIVVRIRPQKANHAIRFLVNWQVIRSSSP
jgi:hypothetical protein